MCLIAKLLVHIRTSQTLPNCLSIITFSSAHMFCDNIRHVFGFSPVNTGQNLSFVYHAHHAHSLQTQLGFKPLTHYSCCVYWTTRYTHYIPDTTKRKNQSIKNQRINVRSHKNQGTFAGVDWPNNSHLSPTYIAQNKRPCVHVQSQHTCESPGLSKLQCQVSVSAQDLYTFEVLQCWKSDHLGACDFAEKFIEKKIAERWRDMSTMMYLYLRRCMCIRSNVSVSGAVCKDCKCLRCDAICEYRNYWARPLSTGILWGRQTLSDKWGSLRLKCHVCVCDAVLHCNVLISSILESYLVVVAYTCIFRWLSTSMCL